MEKRKLPKRFWTSNEYLEEETRHYNIRGMKSKDFKKTYNKVVNPLLKEQGFKCTGYKAFKSDESFYYMINCYINSRGGRCNVTFNVHPIGLPSEGNIEWNEEEFKNKSSLYLFKREFVLENNQEWIDIGYNEEEAIETCVLIKKDIVNQQQIFFSQFSGIREDFFSITPKSFSIESLHEMLRQYGLNGLFNARAILWLSNFHLFHNSMELAKDYAQLAKDFLIENAKKEGTIPNKNIMGRIQSVLSELTNTNTM